MWLLKNKGFEDRSITRDLLANCYAAYRPDSEWLAKFIEAVATTQQSGEKLLEDTIVLQAARRVAQDQSFGRSALLPKISLAEILSKAEQQKEAFAKEQNELGREHGAAQARKELSLQQQTVAYKHAEKLIGLLEGFFVLLAIGLAAAAPFHALMPTSVAIALGVIGLPIAVLSVLDLFGVKLVKPAFNHLREGAAKAIFKLIGGNQI